MTAATISSSSYVLETPRPVLVGRTDADEMLVEYPLLEGNLASFRDGGYTFLTLEERELVVRRVTGHTRKWAKEAGVLIVRIDEKSGRPRAYFRRSPEVRVSKALSDAMYVPNPVFEGRYAEYGTPGIRHLMPRERTQVVYSTVGLVDWVDMAEVMMVHKNDGVLSVHFMRRRVPPSWLT